MHGKCSSLFQPQQLMLDTWEQLLFKYVVNTTFCQVNALGKMQNSIPYHVTKALLQPIEAAEWNEQAYDGVCNCNCRLSQLQLSKFQNVFLKFKLRFLVWLGLKMETALAIIFVVDSVCTSSKVHLVDLRVSNDPGDSLGTLFLSSTVQENGV